MIDAESESRDSIVISGAGVVTPLGQDLDAFWSSLAAGKDGFGPAERLETPAFQKYPACLILGLSATALTNPTAKNDPSAAVGTTAAMEAWRRSGLSNVDVDLTRVALVLGSSAAGQFSRSLYEFTDPADAELRHRLLERSLAQRQTEAIASALDIRGPRLTISTACSSSTNAIGHARCLLDRGDADFVLVGGLDLMTEEIFAGFCAMGAMSPEPCAPFSEPYGMSLGEGAGFVVLERESSALKRVITPLAYLLGFGLSADAHHATSPDPTGQGVARCIDAALHDSGLTAPDIGFINAHGTGTLANDAAEWRGIAQVFGEHSDILPVSSTKSYIGHTLGAAGILELIATMLAMKCNVVLPNLHHFVRRRDAPSDPVASTSPRAALYDVAASTNSAFGGANAAVIVGRSGRPRGGKRRRVFIAGSATVASHGYCDLDRALGRNVPTWKNLDGPSNFPKWAGAIPPIDYERLFPKIDFRGADRISQHLAAAAAWTLQDAGLQIKRSNRDRIGMMVGLCRLPWEAADDFWGSIKERGFDGASAAAYARLVLNAPVGFVSRALDLRGPQSVFVGGIGATLAALIHADELLASSEDLDGMVVGSAEGLAAGLLLDFSHRFGQGPASREPFPVYNMKEEVPVVGESAVGLLLSAGKHPSGLPRKRIVEVVGTGLASPDAMREAIRAALRRAGVGPGEIDAVYGSADGTKDAGERELKATRDVFGSRADGIRLCNPAPILGASENLDAVSLAAAVEALRAGQSHHDARAQKGAESASSRSRVSKILVVGTDGRGSSAACVLARP